MDRSRPDHYSQRAKKEGYPARSVYKLEEIEQKFHILKSGTAVLDIGAAPGSWSMFASRKVGQKGRVISVDLSACKIPKKFQNITCMQGDAFSGEIQKELGKAGPFHSILSDAAPATTGNRTVDTARSAALAEQCIDSAAGLLLPGGNLVIKVFQGGDEQQLIQKLRSLFKSAKAFKPKASRKDSFEIFLVATGYKGSGGAENEN